MKVCQTCKTNFLVTINMLCRFGINLLHQGNMQCIFHFDARFDQGQTVRNTNFPSSSWGHEERSPLPFAKNRHFFMEIRCLPDRFLVGFLYLITCRVHHMPLQLISMHTNGYLCFLSTKYFLSTIFLFPLQRLLCFLPFLLILCVFCPGFV